MNPDAPRISVIIPTLRRPRETLRAIDSALAQTLPPWEVIVVDDASPDDTLAQLRAATATEARVRLHALETNRGGASARNAGAALATGDFLAFLDSDDRWQPDKLQAQHALWQREGGSGDDRLVVYCRARIAYTIRGEHHTPQRAIEPGERVEDYIFLHEQEMQTSGLFMSRRFFDGVRFREGLRRHQDIDFVLRAQRAGARFALCEGVLYERISADPAQHVGTIRDDNVSIDWARSVRHLMSAPAYHRFLLRRVLGVVIVRRPLLALRLAAEALRDRQPVLPWLWRGAILGLKRELAQWRKARRA